MWTFDETRHASKVVVVIWLIHVLRGSTSVKGWVDINHCWYVHLYDADDVAILAPETRNEAGNLHPIVTLAPPLVFALSRPISCFLLLLLVPSAVQRGNPSRRSKEARRSSRLSKYWTYWTHTHLLQTPQYQTSDRYHQLLAILSP
jgi:hypothetical protein